MNSLNLSLGLKLLTLTTLLLAGSVTAGDRFDSLKKKLSSAECSHFEFVSITESQIFESVDSLTGSAWMARDGRYAVNLGADKYVYDGQLLHSYSADNEQVVVEMVDPAHSAIGTEVSFIIHLDEYYRSTVIRPDREYALFRLDSTQTNIPDSLRIYLNATTGFLERLVYYDENEDRQRILITYRELYDSCRPDFFDTSWPEGTDVVKLY